MSNNGTAVARRDESTAVAVQDEETNILAYMQRRRSRVESLLPDGVRFERVLYDVQEAYANQPKLADCTLDSVFRSVVRAQSLGLVIGKTTHLVPKGQRCQLWNDYKGDIELAVRSGAIRYAEAVVVYANEPFRMTRGTSPQIDHEIIADAAKRGEMVGAYCILWISATKYVPHYMPVADIDKIRQEKSLSWKSGPLPAWYAVKTVVRQGLKLIPQNPQLAKWMQEVELAEAGEDGEEVFPARAPRAEIDAMPSRPALGAPSRAVPNAEYGSPEQVAADEQTMHEALRSARPSAAVVSTPEPDFSAEPFPEDLGIDDERPARRARNAIAEP